MQGQRALGAQLHFHLSHSFKERLGFDVTHGTTDFHQRHVMTFTAFQYTTFDFVGNVRNDLNRATQIIAATLFRQHVGINTAGVQQSLRPAA